MGRFNADRLKLVARTMAAKSGIEKTPDEWDAHFRGMIQSYREAAREAGRHDIARLSDRRIWNRIVAIASSA